MAQDVRIYSDSLANIATAARAFAGAVRMTAKLAVFIASNKALISDKQRDELQEGLRS